MIFPAVLVFISLVFLVGIGDSHRISGLVKGWRSWGRLWALSQIIIVLALIAALWWVCTRGSLEMENERCLRQMHL